MKGVRRGAPRNLIALRLGGVASFSLTQFDVRQVRMRRLHCQTGRVGFRPPKDAFLLVPFNCEIVIGEAMFWQGDLQDFMDRLQARIAALAAEVHRTPWL